ncbi:hypothetical protein BJX64DRAFT_265538 [Aspergillus heterothallicus]
MSDSGVQFIAARRRKRPRTEQSSTPQAQSSSAATPRQALPPLELPAVRYAGDGLDFRRPVTTSTPPEEDVIDLTNEPDSPEIVRINTAENEGTSRRPRPPRFGRDIMAPDVVDLDEQSPDPPSSPEVQFLSSTVRQPLPQFHPPPRAHGLMSSNFWRMLPLPQTFGLRREVPWQAAAHLSRTELERLFIGDTTGPMDLTIDYGLEDWVGMTTTPETARPRSSYKAPSPAPEGFTRSVQEEDVAICPNCDEELGTGDDIKQQIWVAKQCGHVYCGECATNRSLAKAKKTASKIKPFAKCQVEDCGKPISAPKSMFQVYL